MFNIGILGYGFVGKACAQLSTNIEIYDKYIDQYKTNIQQTINQDFVFVCVPTNLKFNTLDISSVVEVAELWNQRTNKDSILIIKSTVPLGTSDFLQQKLQTDRIVFCPEFLTERTANLDFVNSDELIIGTSNIDIGFKVESLFKSFFKTNPVTKFCSLKIAELIKLSRNSLYGIKIEFMNELYDLCKQEDIDYDIFRKFFVFEGHNSWVCDQHTYVPGPDGKMGYGGKCLPKDSIGLRSAFKDQICSVLDASIESNKKRRPNEY